MPTDPLEREHRRAAEIAFLSAVRTGYRGFETGDRVELVEPLHATWIDQDLADEEHWEEDARLRANLPAGTKGVVTLVRHYPTPYPYVVAFDRSPACGVRDHQIQHTRSST